MSGTIQQIQRALRKAASKFPLEAENYPMTDIILQVKQEGGELLIFDDNDTELTRCVVEEWRYFGRLLRTYPTCAKRSHFRY